ncbi:MAG TPA: hypothetical protein VF017_18485 [Thermoanaerobaculia bacterium]|nr:hypothetical protein [Thermoanaerobaculia bacterium]
MSWSVEGRVYHSYSEYQGALSRHRDNRLRHLVDRLEIPAADTSRIESALAEAQARRHAVERLGRQVRAEAAERRQELGEHVRRMDSAFAEVEGAETTLLRDLDAAGARLEKKVRALEELRRAEADATAKALQSELAADARDESRARARREQLLRQTGDLLDRAGGGKRLENLGLDDAPLRSLLERARSADRLEGLELARRAHDQARALESEAIWRESRLRSLREVYRAETQSLLQSLAFSDDDRRDLVGEGSAALDQPLRRELDSLLTRIDSVQRYEDHEVRFDGIGHAIDVVGVRVADLVTQVRDFDRLDEARLDLVRNHLADKLRTALGEEVSIQEVRPGALGLQPVEVHLRTAQGEKIDCSVALDGSLRIHHYEHTDQASCARSASRLAERLPELMAMQEKPRLDIAAETGAARAAGNAERTREEPGRTR